MSFNTKEFNKLAGEFNEKYGAEREELEKCLDSKLNADINFVCQEPKSAYLKGIALTFCLKEYNEGVRCQKENKDSWSASCFQENVDFGKCADSALRRLYIYNMEHNKKNPSAPQNA